MVKLPREKSDHREMQSMLDQCQKYMNYHALLTMKDGRMFDGIIDDVQPDRIIVLVGEDVMDDEDNEYDEERQMYGGMHGGKHGGMNDYNRPRRRRRRFRRRQFPLGSIAALSLLQYPYFAPPYPYNFPFYPYNPY